MKGPVGHGVPTNPCDGGDQWSAVALSWGSIGETLMASGDNTGTGWGERRYAPGQLIAKESRIIFFCE